MAKIQKQINMFFKKLKFIAHTPVRADVWFVRRVTRLISNFTVLQESFLTFLNVL